MPVNFSDVIIRETDDLPIKWREASPSGRVIAEIGFGNGEFLEYLGRSEKDALVVGVEVSQTCAAKGARRAAARGLQNIRVMCGDARFLLRHCFEAESVERVYMNFPCPWPKTRHANRRVATPSFAALMNYVLSPGGAFELATDVDWYAKETAAAFSASPAFFSRPVEKNPLRRYLTKYERKWKKMGKDTWLFTAEKTGRLEEAPKKEDDWAMEENTLSNKSVKEILNGLKEKEGDVSNGKGHWVFRDAFLSDANAGLLLVITTDEGFEQHFYLKVLQSINGGITIKVDSVGRPYRTPATRAALLAALAAAGRRTEKETKNGG